jgi:hypothetical protein
MERRRSDGRPHPPTQGILFRTKVPAPVWGLVRRPTGTPALLSPTPCHTSPSPHKPSPHQPKPTQAPAHTSPSPRKPQPTQAPTHTIRRAVQVHNILHYIISAHGHTKPHLKTRQSESVRLVRRRRSPQGNAQLLKRHHQRRSALFGFGSRCCLLITDEGLI